MSQLRTGLEPVTERPFALTRAYDIARPRVSATQLCLATTIALSVAWAASFGALAVQRHLAGGSHAEDLGFTEQVLWNFLPPRLQWFRMSVYAGAAAWNTELDVHRIARPDSLLAFHFEPLLLGLVPLYALGGISLVLIAQAIALASGAIPAYRLGRAAASSPFAGVAVAAAYLLSPLGQWVALSDFHSVAFAAPLLLLVVERLSVARQPNQALIAAALAASTREDVGIAIASLGALALLRDARDRRLGLLLIGIGLCASALGVVVIRAYSGGALPFEGRYADVLSPSGALALLSRKTVGDYAVALVASGGWLGLLAPLSLLPALPSLALNVLSSSDWMASGKAHYSAVVLPMVTISAAVGLRAAARLKPSLIRPTTLALLLTSTLGYVLAGAGPLGANYASAVVADHASRAEALAEQIPDTAAVSASTALVPRVSRRSRVYVFPAVLDADYVFLDVRSSPAPTSAGDVFLRASGLLRQGDWQVDAADNGLLLLERAPGAPPTDIDDLAQTLTRDQTATAGAVSPADARTSPQLVDATLVPSPDGAIDIDGPRSILRTTWQTPAASPPASAGRLSFVIHMHDGRTQTVWDVADLWWNPPDRWPPGAIVRIDVPDIPSHDFASFEPIFTPAAR